MIEWKHLSGLNANDYISFYRFHWSESALGPITWNLRHTWRSGSEPRRQKPAFQRIQTHSAHIDSSFSPMPINSRGGCHLDDWVITLFRQLYPAQVHSSRPLPTLPLSQACSRDSYSLLYPPIFHFGSDLRLSLAEVSRTQSQQEWSGRVVWSRSRRRLRLLLLSGWGIRQEHIPRIRPGKSRISAEEKVLCFALGWLWWRVLAHLNVTCSPIEVHVQILDLAKLSK